MLQPVAPRPAGRHQGAMDEVDGLLREGRLREAEALVWQAIRERRDPAHPWWLRLGELFASRGQLRRALGAFRRAQELDQRGERAFVLHQAVSTLGQLLHRQRRPFLHPDDETSRSKRLTAGASLEPVDEAAFRAQVQALLPVVSAPGVAALESALRFLESAGLDEAHSEQSPAKELERCAEDAVRALASPLRAIHLARYEALLDLEEPEAKVS